MRAHRLSSSLALFASLSACSTPTPTSSNLALGSPSLTVARAPFEDVEASYKERLAQPYLALEVRGSYVHTARHLYDVFAAAEAIGLVPSGPPFAPYYDDPGVTATESLRSRACIPIDRIVEGRAPFVIDVLESTTVAYAFVGGAYPDAPRAYPGVFAFMARMGWTIAGPIREIYLVAPGDVESYADLVCEVQIPALPLR